MNSDPRDPSRKPGKREYRARANRGRGQLIGEDGTQVNHFYGMSRTAGVFVAVLVLAIAVVTFVTWGKRGSETPEAGKTESRQPVSEVVPSTTTSAVTTTRNPTAPIWYNLSKLSAVIWNNGFTPFDPVRIGAAPYPAGIVGGYQSSATDQNDKAVWAIGGQCTAFEASVGKNTDSAGGGTGQFVVIGDDRELYSTAVGPNDPAVDVHVDISGVIRLTLYDTRHLQDATNAWGRPRVLCGSSPGPSR
ncbi:NPCBM/NEW2 domain-containing protein [Nocardia seriolae]|uniref:Glycosyl hydrolase family 98 putative carbohydrate-binding module domain-containing protein n=1 Tax=Nocardia seriolae TaxID=37332 RepID=A0A0B8N7Q6_9NOCA|nr:NPCBM/NEW2 domain-containing protein [Nocardia seriolae]APA99952.1 hypothetical protein NS506_05916 [Nocardia seriolae]MTJ64636.1 hypothetical protein [Nocardia seriolae]MTK42595.1 hypothetical protein [Nocardia seriolae]OJF79635.1 hypothetical protein NS14008_11050 [Nocardia seriolae]QUN16050.1 NPCBM/NEW2 domain-containing protein [Nocardia seriolae]